ncbi:unnamed protein product [marine sediment metagenome]|uniref:Helix-turn-helix domain-containing protein n=1 Tax=marine sediment metagenome TaxID=412755 RepID=X0ZMM5_9ZZZZ
MITTKEASIRLGLTERTIRNYCSKGRLKCEKRGKIWYIEESSLEDVLEVKIIGTEETERKIGKEKDTPKSIALPPYFVIVRQVGYLEAKVEMLERENSLLKEQLTYQKTSWIKRLFKR